MPLFLVSLFYLCLFLSLSPFRTHFHVCRPGSALTSTEVCVVVTPVCILWTLRAPLFQVQNLTLRTQQTPAAAAASGPTPTQPVPPSLALKATSSSSQPLPAPPQGRTMAQGSPAGAKPSVTDSVPEPLKTGDGNSTVEGRPGPGRAVPAVATHPLIAPGKIPTR